jgi:hypothetical protein
MNLRQIVEAIGAPIVNLSRESGVSRDRLYHFMYGDTQLKGGQVLVHPDGTLFWRKPANPAEQILLFDSVTGSQKPSPTLPAGTFSWSTCDEGSGSETSPAVTGQAIIAGDGYLYVPYQYVSSVSTSCDVTEVTSGYTTAHMGIFRVGTDGSATDISIGDWSLSCTGCGPQMGTLITNADQGALFSWQLTSCSGSSCTNQSQLTTINEDASTSTTGLNIPGQSGAIQPVLQRADSSYVGTVPMSSGNNLMLAFTSSGQQLWSQPNDTPQIATSEGGIIGISRTIYDQNGNSTGQLGRPSIPIQAWSGKSYQLGSTEQVESGCLFNAGTESDSSTPCLTKL